MHTVYIGIGSNIGDKKGNIRAALRKLEEFSRVTACSHAYRTKPYGNTHQPDFINLAVCVETRLIAIQLLDRLKKIERELGRVRDIQWGERTIDLDILFYDDLIVDSEGGIVAPILTIPHPDLHNRDFVLRPMMDIAPNLVHPVLEKSIRELYNELLRRPEEEGESENMA